MLLSINHCASLLRQNVIVKQATIMYMQISTRFDRCSVSGGGPELANAKLKQNCKNAETQKLARSLTPVDIESTYFGYSDRRVKRNQTVDVNLNACVS